MVSALESIEFDENEEDARPLDNLHSAHCDWMMNKQCSDKKAAYHRLKQAAQKKLTDMNES